MCRGGTSAAATKVGPAYTIYCGCGPGENWVSCGAAITLKSPIKISCYFSESYVIVGKKS